MCCITDVWLGKYMFTPWFCIIVEAVPWLRCHLLTLLSPRFVPGPDHMGFMVDMRHWGRFLSEYLGFLLSVLRCQCSILIFYHWCAGSAQGVPNFRIVLYESFWLKSGVSTYTWLSVVTLLLAFYWVYIGVTKNFAVCAFFLLKK